MMRNWIVMAGILVGFSMPLSAQETRVAGEDHAPPPATIGEVDWLIGQWAGEGIGSLHAYESWLPPSGGTMVGTFVQEAQDGSVMFTEHMYLMENEGSLEVRLKHFGPDLNGWEDKEGMERFRLIALEDCAAYFSALTYRCDGDDAIIVAVRVESDSGEPEELTFRFQRVASE